MFRGSAPATIDDKGRLKVPAEFRRQLEERYGAELFVTSVDGAAASLYPLPVWEQIEARLLAMPTTHPVRLRFLERVSYFGQQVQLDSQGRLVVPTILRASAEMNGEVVVSGRLDHMVVWNRQRFETKITAEPFDQKDFEALSAFGI
jgi:MraZ protein